MNKANGSQEVFEILADVYDELTLLQKQIEQLKLRVNKLESREENLPLGYSRLQIAELMTENFDVQEVNSMAWDMAIEEDELTGTTRGERVRALIGRCEKQHKMHELIYHCKRLRPHVAWPAPPHQR